MHDDPHGETEGETERQRERTATVYRRVLYRSGQEFDWPEKIYLLVDRVGTLFIKVPRGEIGLLVLGSKEATIRSGIPKTCARYIGFKVCPGCVARRVIERRLKRGRWGRGSGKRVLDNASFITAKGGVIECGGNYARELDNL